MRLCYPRRDPIADNLLKMDGKGPEKVENQLGDDGLLSSSCLLGHVLVWSEGDPQWGGGPQGHPGLQPGAPAGLHVPRPAAAHRRQHPGSGCSRLPTPRGRSLQVGEAQMRRQLTLCQIPSVVVPCG